MDQKTSNHSDSKQSDGVEQAMLDLISNQATRVPLPVLIALIIMSVIAFKHLPWWMVGAWFFVAACTALRRYVTLSAIAQRKTVPATERLIKFVKLNFFGGIVHSIALGAFPFFSEAERAFFSILLMGLCTGAVATSAGYRPALLAYVTPIMVGLALMWSIAPGFERVDFVERVIGLLLLFYLAVLLGLARELNRGIVEAWDIRMREKELNVQLKKALENAENASRAKTRFLAAASHDLRQPLHTITMLGAALGLRSLDNRSKEIVGLLNDVSLSFSEQLDGLLDISKLDAGVIVANMQAVKISDLLSQHAIELRGHAEAKGLKLDLICTTDACLLTDAALFNRILRNLTQNALKFTERGGITLTAHERLGAIELEVADTGLGIALDQQDKVFQEFYQIGNPERDRQQGLGLGLSIVKRLVDLLDMTLRMDSVPGKGTKFTLQLGLAEVSTPQIRDASLRVVGDTFNLRVLVIDDDKKVRVGLRILLEELGCSCLEANGTEQAMLKVANTRPDLILADFRLRGNDSGLLAIASVHGLWPDVPAVLVSGDTAPDRLQEAQHVGVALLHKPVQLEILKQELLKVQLP